jgi:hypothetical protein
MYKKYLVRLTDQERSQLQTLLRSGRAHARKLLSTLASCSRPTPKDPTNGPTRGSLMPSRFQPPRWLARGGAFARMDWMWRSCQRSLAGQGEGCSMLGARLI